MTNHTEDKMATEESRNLSAILSSMREGLVIVDKQLKITLMNQVAGVLLRVAPADGMGKDVHEVFTFFQGSKQIPSKDSPISRAVREMSTIKVRLEYDLFCKNKAGQLFPIEISVTSPSNYGKIGGVIIFNNVTREKEIDRMKTEFVSIASHQLRTPLTAIKLFIEMLINEEAGKLNAKQKDYMNNVQESTERMIHFAASGGTSHSCCAIPLALNSVRNSRFSGRRCSRAPFRRIRGRRIKPTSGILR